MVGCPKSKLVISTDHNKGFWKAMLRIKAIIFSLSVDIYHNVELVIIRKWQI